MLIGFFLIIFFVFFFFEICFGPGIFAERGLVYGAGVDDYAGFDGGRLRLEDAVCRA